MYVSTVTSDNIVREASFVSYAWRRSRCLLVPCVTKETLPTSMIGLPLLFYYYWPFWCLWEMLAESGYCQDIFLRRPTEYGVGLDACFSLTRCTMFTVRSGRSIYVLWYICQGVLHSSSCEVLGKNGGAMLRHVQFVYRQGLREVRTALVQNLLEILKSRVFFHTRYFPSLRG